GGGGGGRGLGGGGGGRLGGGGGGGCFGGGGGRGLGGGGRRRRFGRRGGRRRGRRGGRRGRAPAHPAHLVLLVRALRALGVDRQLHVPALLGLRRELGEQAGEVVCPAGVESGRGTAAAVVVLTDEDVGVVEDDLVPGGPHHLERHVGEQVARVVAVEV